MSDSRISNNRIRRSTFRLAFLFSIVLFGGCRIFDGTLSTLGEVAANEMATEQDGETCTISDGILNCKKFDGIPKEEASSTPPSLLTATYAMITWSLSSLWDFMKWFAVPDKSVFLLQDGRLLIKAVLSSDIEMARELLDKGVNVSAISWLGSYPLSWAANSKNMEMVRLLLDAGANTEITTWGMDSRIFFFPSMSTGLSSVKGHGYPPTKPDRIGPPLVNRDIVPSPDREEQQPNPNISYLAKDMDRTMVEHHRRRYSTYRLIFLLLTILLGGFGSFDGIFSTLGRVAACELLEDGTIPIMSI
eukprot:gene23627-30638_t